MSDRPHIRPYRKSDEIVLDEYRDAFSDGVLEVPYGYDRPPYVETAVSHRTDGTLVASLTKTLVAALDPYIHDPSASPIEVAIALRQLSVALEYAAQKDGAAEVVMATPEHMTEFHRVLEHNGWERTAPNCIIYRKPLLGGTDAGEDIG